MLSSNKYNTFFIDTCIYDRFSCIIESGILEQLCQFKDSDVKILVTDTTHNELVKHLSINIEKAIDKLKTAINKGRFHLLNISADLIEIKNKIQDLESIELIAENRILTYYKNIGADIIYASDYLDISLLLKHYFKSLPPFENSKDKKAEFPDAIALMTLEGWAQKNNKIVIVVTDDNGCKDFCNNSKWLHYENNLKNVITSFQPKTYVTKFLNLISSIGHDALSEYLDNDIKKAIIYNAENSDIDIEANCHHEYEYDDTEIEYIGYDFLTDLCDLRHDIISIDNDKVVFQVIVNIDCKISASFSFSIYDSFDKEYLHLGGNHYSINTKYERTIIIELSGPYADNDLSKMRLSRIDISSNVIHIEFGEIDIYFSDDDYIND